MRSASERPTGQGMDVDRERERRAGSGLGMVQTRSLRTRSKGSLDRLSDAASDRVEMAALLDARTCCF